MEGRPSDAESSSDESDQEIWAEMRRERREKRREEQDITKSYPNATVVTTPTFTPTPSTLKPTATLSRYTTNLFVCSIHFLLLDKTGQDCSYVLLIVYKFNVIPCRASLGKRLKHVGPAELMTGKESALGSKERTFTFHKVKISHTSDCVLCVLLWL